MKKRTVYGPEIKAQALVLYSTGMSYHAIARLLKVTSPSTIRLWIDPKVAERNAQYQAQYRQENKERIAQYREKNKERIAQQKAQYRKENKESIAQYNAKYRQENKERRAQYREENKERIAQYHAQYYQENPEKYRARDAKRRASKRNATPPWFALKHQREIEALQAEAVLLQQETGTPYHVDHIYPLTGKTMVNGKYQHTSCGLHVPWNLRVLSGPENLSKNCKMPDPAIDPPTAW